VNRICAITLALVLTGCFGGPPTHYYSLIPVASSDQPQAESGKPLQILRVTTPATLDRQSMVEWSGQGELTISNQNLWAAPLDEMIQGTLAEDLRDRTTTPVLLPGDPVPNAGSAGIIVNIQHFGAEKASRRVTLVADWSLVAGQPAAVIVTRSESIATPLHSDDADAVVLAMSRALAELSQHIARALMLQEVSRPSARIEFHLEVCHLDCDEFRMAKMVARGVDSHFQPGARTHDCLV
jgi:uncharacterized lipoprotein YmbA